MNREVTSCCESGYDTEFRMRAWAASLQCGNIRLRSINLVQVLDSYG